MTNCSKRTTNRRELSISILESDQPGWSLAQKLAVPDERKSIHRKGVNVEYTEQDLQAMHDKIIAVRESEGEGERFWDLLEQYATIDESLKPYVKNNREAIEANIGNYISLKGHGIMDGLKVFCKWDLYKIVGYDSEGSLVLHRYKAKRNVYLPPHAQDQEYKIYTSAEYQKLPSNY